MLTGKIDCSIKINMYTKIRAFYRILAKYVVSNTRGS